MNKYKKWQKRVETKEKAKLKGEVKKDTGQKASQIMALQQFVKK